MIAIRFFCFKDSPSFHSITGTRFDTKARYYIIPLKDSGKGASCTGYLATTQAKNQDGCRVFLRKVRSLAILLPSHHARQEDTNNCRSTGFFPSQGPSTVLTVILYHIISSIVKGSVFRSSITSHFDFLLVPAIYCWHIQQNQSF
jgi:hypothetical protein